MREGICSSSLYIYSEILYNFKYYLQYFSAVQAQDK